MENGLSEVWARTVIQIGEQLNVDPSTVCRTVQLFEETGTVHSIQGYHESTKKLTTQDEIEANPMYLHELQYAIYLSSGTSVCTAIICNFYANKIFRGTSLPSLPSRGTKITLSEISVLDPHICICGRNWQ